jgi:hypothetical protein
MITASGLERVMECPASETFPHVSRTSEFAEAGTARHTFLEHVGDIGLAEALKLVPVEHREMCEAIDFEELPTNLASEVAFAYNWKTGKARELGRGIGRDYSNVTPYEIAGTIDVLGVGPESVYCGDYKGHASVKARGNPQLLFAALCATKVYGRDAAITEIINVRPGGNFRSKASVDVFDLDDFALRLADTAQIVEAFKTGDISQGVREGAWCRYCPAFQSCPAKVSLLREMVVQGSGDLLPLNEGNAAEAYVKYQAMRSMLSKVHDAIYAYAFERPIPLGDGRVFGAREKDGNEVLDGDVTYEVIREQLGQEAADVAVSRKATKKGIDKAIALAKPKGTKKAAVESVLVAVRARDGVTRSRKTVIEEYKLELTP